MARLWTVGWVVALAALVLSACAGNGDVEISEPAATSSEDTNAGSAEDPTATSRATAEAPEATPTPTTAAPVPVSEADRIEAAKLAFANDLGAQFEAFDFLSETVEADNVELSICAWEGDDSYDEVLEVRYATATDDAGELLAELKSTNSSAQSCLNTELVESALAFIAEHDVYWTSVLEDPTTFDPAVRAPDLFTPGNLELVIDLVAGWVEDEVYWRSQHYGGDVRETSKHTPLFRRYEGRFSPVLAVVVCRPVQEGYGLFRDGLLLDDFTSGLDELGPDAVIEYIILRQDGEWRVSGINSLVWADCLAGGTFVDGINGWKPDPVAWQELPW